ncbi:MAG: DNA alkylation repair protein [Rhizobiaceae bacterium]
MPRSPHTPDQALARLKEQASEANRAGMARFGIDTARALGVSMPAIRAIAADITKDHDLAQALWESEIHEARILAGLVDRPEWVTMKQMDAWAGDFTSWDLCDQICGALFCRNEHGDAKIRQWENDSREFVKRAAFATIAWRAVHARKAGDAEFLPYLEAIERQAGDPRNFVRKAVNWALRQIGKRSLFLHGHALELSHRLAASPDKTARWIGKDAVRELEKAETLARFK